MILNNFDGQFIEGELSAFAHFKGGTEFRVVLFKYFQDGSVFVLQEAFDFVVGEFALVEYLGNAVIAMGVAAHVCGEVAALIVAAFAETQLVAAGGAGEVPAEEFKVCFAVGA